MQCAGAVAARKGIREMPTKGILLCRVERFGDEKGTCFEIHHSKGDYPELPCMQNNEESLALYRTHPRAERETRTKKRSRSTIGSEK